MTDRRIDVVAEVLEAHPWFEDDGCCECGWRYGVAHPTDPSHEYHQAIAVIAALDIAARTRPFIGMVPPVRLWADRDRSGEVEESEVTLEEAVAGVEATRHEGIGEFHKDTSHNTEA